MFCLRFIIHNISFNFPKSPLSFLKSQTYHCSINQLLLPCTVTPVKMHLYLHKNLCADAYGKSSENRLPHTGIQPECTLTGKYSNCDVPDHKNTTQKQQKAYLIFAVWPPQGIMLMQKFHLKESCVK